MTALDFGLSLAGLPQETIKDLDTHLPALARIAAAVHRAEPVINQLIPILAPIWPDVVAVTPLVQELIAFAKQKETGV